MNFKRKNSVVLLHSQQDIYSLHGGSSSVEVILSPSLYWVKRVKLSVKYLREVRAILPSLFEEILPHESFSYAVFRDGEYFCAFAYEDRVIIELLAKHNIAPSDVYGIYFAQFELDLRDHIVALNENEVLAKEEDIVVCVPSQWYDSARPLTNEELKRSKNATQLQQFSHIIKKSTLYKIFALALFFILLLGVEIFVTQQKIQNIQKEQEEIKKEYKLYATMMQTKAVLQELQRSFKKDSNLRELLHQFFTLNLAKDQKITEVTYKNGSFTVVISKGTKKLQKRVEKMLKSYGEKAKVRLVGETLHAEVQL